MKTSLRTLFLLLLPALLILGCKNGPIESLTFTSPEGNRTIKVTGDRSTALAPIMAHVTLVVPAGEKTFTFEHQASSLTSKNVTAHWENNNMCTLKFVLDDDDYWEVECYLLDDRVEAIKRFKIDGKNIFN